MTWWRRATPQSCNNEPGKSARLIGGASCAIEKRRLIIWKKPFADKHVPYDAIVEEALCFGWVDSLPRKLIEETARLAEENKRANQFR